MKHLFGNFLLLSLEHYINHMLFFLHHHQSPAICWLGMLSQPYVSVFLPCCFFKRIQLLLFLWLFMRWLFPINFNLTFIEAQFLFPPYEVVAKCKDSESSYSYSFLITHTKIAIQVETVRNWHWLFFNSPKSRQTILYLYTDSKLLCDSKQIFGHLFNF